MPSGFLMKAWINVCVYFHAGFRMCCVFVVLCCGFFASLPRASFRSALQNAPFSAQDMYIQFNKLKKKKKFKNTYYTWTIRSSFYILFQMISIHHGLQGIELSQILWKDKFSEKSSQKQLPAIFIFNVWSFSEELILLKWVEKKKWSKHSVGGVLRFTHVGSLCDITNWY